MAKTVKQLLKIKRRTVVTAACFFFLFFCFAGGLNLLDGLFNSFSTNRDARYGVTAAFYTGFLFTGFFGLMFALKNRTLPMRCLLGFAIVGFSYIGCEVLLNAVRG